MLRLLIAGLCFVLPSRPTRILFRLCGHRIGRNARIPAFSFIHADEMELGDDVDIRRFVYIRVRRLRLRANTIVSYGCQIKGDAGFFCGDSCFLGIHCLVHCVENVTFGAYSGLGPRCTVYTHGSFLPATQGYPVRFAPVVLEDHVWIAMEVTIMPGSHVERNCIINPHVVVQGRVRSNSIIQIDPKSYDVLDLRRLQLIGNKDVAFWHRQIITGFLKSRGLAFNHNERAGAYVVTGRITFVSRPDVNTIEIQIGRKRIAYDLESFVADESRDPIHKKFMAFIRLHFGLTLKTRYRK
jgi:acetyltransferase-like isoleucine patch superfamily enzyme